MKLAIIAITRNGARLGARLKSGIPGAELYALPKYLGTAGKGATAIECELKQLFERLWPEIDGFVCIMATGIVIRLVAPLLEGKDRDPAVVVMDDAGRFSISLLSGHLGGANELAERCAFITGARAVITTATDANDLPSFDMLARDNGWVIEDLSRVKVLNSLLLDGETISVVDDTDTVRSYFHGRGHLQFNDSFVAGLRCGAKGFLFVTSSIIPPVAIYVFILGNITGLPFKTIYKGVFPFLSALVLALIILFTFPQIATWLPNLMMGRG